MILRKGAACGSGTMLLLVLFWGVATGMAAAGLSGSMGPPGEPRAFGDKMVFVFENVIKSEHEKCSYRFLTLPNKLQVLLISEPGLDKASAALDVHVGNFYDPKDVPGLAHFLEHLLFMGTQKYPNENEYGQYLSAHGGHSNAFTAEEHTNYFFDVASDHLEDALDRFAQFFISPLFNEDGTARELRAVDSEHQKNVRNDHWRLNQLEKTLSNPDHPYSHFSTGNLATLKEGPEREGVNIRKVLIDFYGKHYSANLMKLVVYGKDPLDRLQEMVVDRFSAVPNHGRELAVWKGMPLGADQLKKIIYAETVKDIRTLYVIWQLPDLHQYNMEKPEHYFSHLIGHEGAGSLLSYLKAKGWANSLGAGADADSRGFSFFQVSIDLSPTGLEHSGEVIKVVFQYLQMLRMHGAQQWIYDEAHSLESLGFEFMEKGQPSTFSFKTAGHMQYYPPEYILKGPRVSMRYDKDVLDKILALLNAENFRILIATSGPLVADHIETEKWYGTKYHVKDVDPALLAFLQNPTFNSALAFPHPNRFIPRDLKPKMAAVLVPAIRPELIVDEGQYKLWFKQDDVFEMPKGCFEFLMISPVAHSSASSFVKTYLFISLLRDSLTEVLYEAEMAGLFFAISQNNQGVSMSFSGYHEKLPDFIKIVMGHVLGFRVEEKRFDVAKDKFQRWLNSVTHDTPYSLVSYYLNGLQQERNWWYWEKAEALGAVTHTDIESVARELFLQADIEALCHGNYRQDEALLILKSIREALHRVAPLPSKDLIMPRVVQLNRTQSVVFSPPPIPNENAAIQFYLQIGSLGDLRLRTLTKLFTQVFHEPFFNDLRTEQQLGYVVRHQIWEKGSSTGMAFVVQSEKSPVFLDERIEEFISKTLAVLYNMSEDDFNSHIKALVNKLLAKKRRMNEETHVYWSEILLHQYEFERVFMDSQYMRKLTKQDLITFVQQYVLAGAPERRKLSVHVWPQKLAQERTEAYASLQHGTDFFDQPGDMVKTMSLFPLLYPIPQIGSVAFEQEISNRSHSQP